MSGRSSPSNGGYESARLTVRKDLFPSEPDRLSPDFDDEELVSCVKLETDFEQSIDEIAIQKQQLLANGNMSSPARSRHKKHKRRDAEREPNGCLSDGKRKKRSRHRTRSGRTHVPVISGKNLNLVSSSEYRGVTNESDSEDQEPEPEEAEEELAQSSSDDEVLKYSVKLPLVKPRQSGKPYSHELSQLSTKKRKRDKERHSHVVTPCTGKPRSMMLHSSRSKRKSKKCESVVAPEPVPEPPAPPPATTVPTYRSQIVDTHTMKIKIRRASVHETVVVSPPVAAPAPAPTLSVSDIGQRKSKKKRAASPVASESSGEEYDPTKGDTAAAMSVAAPKARHRPRNRKNHKLDKSSDSKPNNSKNKSEKTERNRISVGGAESGPQSPWGSKLPSELLLNIFHHVVASQGALPALIRLGRVCKLWHSVSCMPELWRHVDLAHHTVDKCKTDYKLVWLLEHRLSQCHSLNIAQWKVCNVAWVLACVAEYCPHLCELSLAGWSRVTPDQLFELLQGLPQLQRLDLSHTSETGGSSTCLSAASMARVADKFGARLTHLTLASNKFTALPQILASVAAHCVNLEVLDISGALATSHPAAVPLEALQRGCPKLRVFRAANSQLVLQAATTQQQMECDGWSQLEELSIAGEAASELVGEYKLGDEALSRLVRGATRLRLLDLRGLQRLTDSGLVRVPAWELQHLFLGGCNVTRQSNACLELICEKWSHSLIELDLSWASASRPLDDAVAALADAPTSRLRTLNLCGSSVSLEPVKKVLLKCTNLESINLSSCRALPRGMKRLYTGKELQDLKDSLDPEKVKAKEQEKETKTKTKKGKESKKAEADSKSDAKDSSSSALDTSDLKPETKAQDEASFLFQEPRSVASSAPSEKSTPTPEAPVKASPDSKTVDLIPGKEEGSTPTPEGRSSIRDATPALLSPPDSSCTPRAQPSPRYSPAARPDSQHASPAARPDSQHASPAARPDSQHVSPATRPDSQHASPVARPDSQHASPAARSDSRHASPDVFPDQVRHNWSLGAYKTTPTHKSAEASPLNRLDGGKLRLGKALEQCSPTTSLDSKRSPDALKPDIKNPASWNYGNYSPMPRQETFTAQRSPYSAQPSPYSTQPSPYSAQPSPYSSQPSPYSAAASPDTSQVSKGGWHASPEPRRPPPGRHSPAEWGWPEPAWGAPPPRRADPWPLPQYREEPPLDAFVEQSVSFESLRGAAPLLPPHAYLDDAFSEGSRLD